jgi:hypothetical protein
MAGTLAFNLEFSGLYRKRNIRQQRHRRMCNSNFADGPVKRIAWLAHSKGASRVLLSPSLATLSSKGAISFVFKVDA